MHVRSIPVLSSTRHLKVAVYFGENCFVPFSSICSAKPGLACIASVSSSGRGANSFFGRARIGRAQRRWRWGWRWVACERRRISGGRLEKRPPEIRLRSQARRWEVRVSRPIFRAVKTLKIFHRNACYAG